ncbi:MAG: response regulator [Deltaproteobacteria bacterium]|nr:response regulator [Deltaproteobacteria bacterium]
MEPIIIIDSDKEQCRKLREILGAHHYPADIFPSLLDMEEVIEEKDPRVVILNLDTVPIDNRKIKDIKQRNRSINIIVFSGKSFHPELKEALRDHIYACLKQPLDYDELIYWVNTAYENGEK